MKPQKLFFILFLIFIVSSTFAQETISSGRLSITIQNLGDGVELTSIKDSGTEVLNTTTNPDLFTLYINNIVTATDEVLTASTGWTSIIITNNGDNAIVSLSHPTNANLPVSLTVSIEIETNDEKSSWDIAVTGLGSDCSLLDVEFPNLNIIAEGNDTFFYPLYSGRLTENPGSGVDYFNDEADATDNSIGIYPRGWGTTMQFFSYYNAGYGIYFGFHDPDASLKEFGVKDENFGLKISCSSPVADKTLTGNNWEFPGVFQLDLYNGDWYDAALIYKEWVSTSANYWPQETPERIARQHKVGDLGVWLTTADFLSLSMAEMETYIQTAIDFFEVPVGISLYEWSYSEHDHFYPMFFPERTGLSDLIATIQDNNDAVLMPYINGRLWDTGVGGADEGDATAATYYANEGVTDASKRADNSIYTEVFAANTFAIMCPAQPDWQDVMIDASYQVADIDRLNAGAVYIDMVTASAPTQCMDGTHNHTLGGGNFWRDGYNQMFEGMHNSIPTDKFLTTEGGNDFLADEVDAFMVQGWTTDHQVPAWQAIYTGKVQLFGTKTGGSHYGLQKFYGRLAQGFAYGVQTGRQFMWLAINPEANVDKQMASSYVKTLSNMRYKLRDFMSYGEMKRPIIPESLPAGTTIPTITYDVYDWGGHRDFVSVTTSAIQKSVWQNANEVVVLFVNGRIQSPAGTVGGNINFEFDFNPNDYGLTGDITIQEITPSSDGAILAVDNDTFPKDVNLQNLELVAYKISGDANLSMLDENVVIPTIYPNPTKDLFKINHDADDIEYVKLYNSLGQLVLTATPENKIVDVSNLVNGFYIVSIQTVEKEYISKLIKE